MKLWTECNAETYFADETAIAYWNCQVRIGDSTVAVIYEDEDGSEISYTGKEESPGHFTLENVAKEGRGSLHMFSPAAKIMEGYWIEGGAEGMWRIHLADAETEADTAA